MGGLEVQIGVLLRDKGLRLSIAESCTGGLLGHLITNIPGSSTYYMGSITAYAYEAKVRLLGVKWATLEKYGAVSEETVREMAAGVRQALASDIGLSITGIAGPSGGTTEKPVGLVYFGLSTPKGEWTLKRQFQGDRMEVKNQSAQQGMQFILDYLADHL